MNNIIKKTLENYNNGREEMKNFKPKIKNGNVITFDYRKMREEIYEKSKQLIEFDGYINSEKFDKEIYKLMNSFIFNVLGIDLLEEQLIELKHEITSFVRGKYFGVK